MGDAKPCPDCGRLAEKVVYETMGGDDDPEDLEVWECPAHDLCGWMEDAEED